MCDMLDMSNYRALSACVIDTPDSLLSFLFIDIERYLSLLLPLSMEYCLMIPRLHSSNTFHRINFFDIFYYAFLYNTCASFIYSSVCDSS